MFISAYVSRPFPVFLFRSSFVCMTKTSLYVALPPIAPRSKRPRLGNRMSNARMHTKEKLREEKKLKQHKSESTHRPFPSVSLSRPRGFFWFQRTSDRFTFGASGSLYTRSEKNILWHARFRIRTPDVVTYRAVTAFLFPFPPPLFFFFARGCLLVSLVVPSIVMLSTSLRHP